MPGLTRRLPKTSSPLQHVVHLPGAVAVGLDLLAGLGRLVEHPQVLGVCTRTLVSRSLAEQLVVVLGVVGLADDVRDRVARDLGHVEEERAERVVSARIEGVRHLGLLFRRRNEAYVE